jgi:AbrB family looped-hinge helix DNA binding protein
MRITSKGQVTIPIEIRERLGLFPETEVDFVVDGNGARIVRRTERQREGRGDRIVRRLRGTGSVRMSTDEILALTRKQ